MPIYEYFCPTCKVKFEQLRPISCADKDTACEKCSGPARRVPSTFSAFNKSDSGTSSSIAGAGGGCSGCSSTNCSSCG